MSSSTLSNVANLTGFQISRYFFMSCMSSFLAVSRSSFITVMILSSMMCMVCRSSVSSCCTVFISFVACLWFVSMFCSTTSNFRLSSLFLSSLIRSLAVSVRISSSSIGGGGAGFPCSGFVACSIAMVNVYIVLLAVFKKENILNLRNLV